MRKYIYKTTRPTDLLYFRPVAHNPKLWAAVKDTVNSAVKSTTQMFILMASTNWDIV